MSGFFPWTQSPLIVNAPMGGIAGPALATAVTKAGGLGLMGLVNNLDTVTVWLDEIENAFTSDPFDSLAYLPVGIGFLVFLVELDQVLAVLSARQTSGRKPPAVIWLFAAQEPSVEAYGRWAGALRKLYASGYTPQIWIQAGGSASRAAEAAKVADVLVVQGADAGGHGCERGASVVSLVPEVRGFLKDAKDVKVLASGGIVDGRGVLAAMALGADGVVMGTRFLACPETSVHEKYRERIVAARDGAVSTVRAKVFDQLHGENIWPVEYDGRALVSESWRGMKAGKAIETIREEHAEALQKVDGGFALESDRAAIWAGTGVGLVDQEQSAGDVVREVREQTLSLAQLLNGRVSGKL